jgi:superfamily II DNA or RNA helicase
MLGLSATPVRKDGLSRVIHWFIGPTFFEYVLTGKKEVSVQVTNFNLNCRMPVLNTKNIQTSLATTTTLICNMHERNKLIIDKITDLAAAGHKVILLSDRRSHCKTLKDMLSTAGIEGALYLGGMKNADLELSKEKDVLFATYSMAKEGLDIPELDALILATPRSDVIQACGRILHGKTDLSPIIVDIVDNWPIGNAQFRKRQIYYKKAGFTVTTTI